MIDNNNRKGIIMIRTIIAAIAVTLGIATPAAAFYSQHGDAAKAPGITVGARHGLVIMSALPHCKFEDGSGGRTPCTWNIGPASDGNGRGLAYWVNRPHGEFKYHYVWDRNPVAGHPHREWVIREMANSIDGLKGPVTPWCYIQEGPTSTIHCPDGYTLSS